MKYSTLPRSSELEPHHHIQFSVMPRITFFERVLTFCKGYCQCILKSANTAITHVKEEVPVVKWLLS